MFSTRAKLLSDARCLIKTCPGRQLISLQKDNVGRATRGWPLGLTPGPWREWHGTISTSSGKCFSNAAISGALHEVWPPTIAPSFVAAQIRYLGVIEPFRRHTRAIFSDDAVDVFGFNTIDDVVTATRDEMAIRIDLDSFLDFLSKAQRSVCLQSVPSHQTPRKDHHSGLVCRRHSRCEIGLASMQREEICNRSETASRTGSSCSKGVG
jgi:hypothetical protein